MKYFFQFAALGILFCFNGCATSTTYVLVRHAEKLDASKDTPISPQGEQRAEKLEKQLLSCWKNIDLVYASQYQRTLQTVQPVANALHLTPRRYRTDSLDHFISELQQQKGKTILIASHSNKVNLIFNALSDGEDIPEIPDSYYEGIYVVQRHKGKSKQWILAQDDFKCPVP